MHIIISGIIIFYVILDDYVLFYLYFLFFNYLFYLFNSLYIYSREHNSLNSCIYYNMKYILKCIYSQALNNLNLL